MDPLLEIPIWTFLEQKWLVDAFLKLILGDGEGREGYNCDGLFGGDGSVTMIVMAGMVGRGQKKVHRVPFFLDYW